jgi:hypothetical protein
MKNFPKQRAFYWLCSVICLMAYSSYAQTAHKIEWQNTRTFLTEDSREIPVISFEGAFQDSRNHYLPVFRTELNENVKSVIVKNAIYQPLSASEKATPDTAYITPHVSVSIGKQWWRGKQVSYVSVCPLRRNAVNGRLEKLVTFDLVYEKESQHQTNMFEPKSTNDGVETSVLASGTWYKLAVTQSGFYRIDRNMLQLMGFNMNGTNPKRLKLYGNGGGMLPQPNASARPQDLVENAVWISGEQDQSFDANDYLVFYAQAPSKWQYNAGLKTFSRINNIYSDTAYYFITLAEGADGLRVASRESLPTASTRVNSFDDYWHHEQDRFNPFNSGRVWYGEVFDLTLEREFRFPVEGLLTTSPVTVRTAVMGRALITNTFFSVSVNGQLQNGAMSMRGHREGAYADYGSDSEMTYKAPLQNLASQITVKLSYNKNGNSSAVGYLNFIEVNAKRSLALYGNQTSFRSIASIGQAQTTFAMANAGENAQIWDLSNPQVPVLQKYTTNNDSAVFAFNTTSLTEMAAFKNGSQLPTPILAGSVANQNLHGASASDLVIITHPNFLAEANRLAAFRTQNDGLDVTVATTTQIYNEFSSGAQDLVAMRDFIRHLYKKTPTPKLKYVLLFGDCSYDYKYRTANNSNFVPIYQSSRTLHEIASYCSDDFVGFMDETEGRWEDQDVDRIDLGIGRLPVRTAAEAKNVVNKLMAYNAYESVGKWRNQITFVADDGDGFLHQGQADDMSKLVETNYQKYNVNKIYLAANPTIATPSGELSPVTRQAINTAVEKGSLIVNYVGHGSRVQWAQESILTMEQVNKWENINNLPFFVTATCDYGRYDSPQITSGGENLVLKPNGGGIGVLATGRPVYSDSNKLINVAFYNSVFKKLNGLLPRMGDVMMTTKNNSITGMNNKGFALLGDPSMRLAYPTNEVVATAINDRAFTVTDTISGLERVTIEGEVRANGQRVSNFNGTLNATLFDKAKQIIATENGSSSMFTVRKDIIYNGNARVENGLFKFSFVTPKDIAYTFDKGKLSMYAYPDDSTLHDAHGSTLELTIGGSDDNAVPDNDAPLVRLFMNDTTFINGGITTPNPTFLAKLTDDNGINVSTTGIGHEMTLILDNDETNMMVVSDFYTTEANTYKKGEVRMPLQDLSAGLHTLRFKAWDTHNNSVEQSITFVVSNSPSIVLDKVYNYPNSFEQQTTFVVEHNNAGDNLDIEIEIYNYMGQVVNTISSAVADSPSRVEVASGNALAGLRAGIYPYSVIVKSSDGNVSRKMSKLVVLK